MTGTIELPEGVEMECWRQHQNRCHPIHPIATDDGSGFAIREGGRTVGAGVVAKVWLITR